MALFTESQANACIITKIKKIVDGSNCAWNIGFKDDNGIHYEFTNSELSSSASKSNIKSVALSKIQTMDKSAVLTTSTTDEKGLGVDETVG
jgi:hypothetical protein